jgi:hypothetical protein
MFNANELEEGVGHSVDSNVGVWDVLATMRTTLGLFKTLTNVALAEFMSHARSTSEHNIQILNLRFVLKKLF